MNRILLPVLFGDSMKMDRARVLAARLRRAVEAEIEVARLVGDVREGELLTTDPVLALSIDKPPPFKDVRKVKPPRQVTP